jgi:glycosyltransferase involved in cell wall biosynthesis
MKPKITFISVTYNDAECISDTIDSVVEQKTKRPDIHLEYVIVDGASTDGTIEIINSRSTEVDRWVSEEDNGIYDAMNKGLRMVADGYIIFLGAGDKIISLASSQLLLENNLNVFYGDVWMGSQLFVSHLNYKLRRGNSLHHQGLLIHKSIFPEQGFNTKYKAYADYELNIKLLNSGVNFVKVDELIGYQMPGGLTSKVQAEEILDIVKNNFGAVCYFMFAGRFILYEIKSKLLRQQSTLVW